MLLALTVCCCVLTVCCYVLLCADCAASLDLAAATESGEEKRSVVERSSSNANAIRRLLGTWGVYSSIYLCAQRIAESACRALQHFPADINLGKKASLLQDSQLEPELVG